MYARKRWTERGGRKASSSLNPKGQMQDVLRMKGEGGLRFTASQRAAAASGLQVSVEADV